MKQPFRQRLRKALLSIAGIMESPGTFYEEDAFWVNGKEIGHFHESDVLELRLTRKVISAERTRLKNDPRVELRRGTSDWVKLRFSSNADLPFVLELAEQAVAAHRAAPASRRGLHRQVGTSNVADVFIRTWAVPLLTSSTIRPSCDPWTG